MDPDRVYEYAKITAEDIIRLILLQPSKDLEAGIQCSLICVTLDECDKDIAEHYIALSYVWGDATAKRQISVDGAKLEITASLDCALRHLRDASRVLRVWADGICINQDDFDDRNRQVRIMSSIYSLAHHTIIFLGPCSPEHEIVMEFLASRDYRLDKPKKLVKSGENSLDGMLEILVEENLLTNPWFTRVWILQELVLSADPWVQYGTIRIRWDTFCNPILSSTSSVWSPDSRKHLSAMNDARSKFKGGKVGKVGKDGTPSVSPGNDIWGLLRERRGSGASDPRDMIYAHLSLTDLKQQASISIRYDLSVAEVYELLARDNVVWIDDCSILFDVEDLELDKRRRELPSWVPDWTKPTPKSSPKGEHAVDIHGRNYYFCGTGFTLPTVPRIFCIVGREKGVVKKIFPESFWMMPHDKGDDTEFAKSRALITWMKDSFDAQEVLRIICNGFIGRYMSRQNSSERLYGTRIPEERIISPELLSFLLPFVSEQLDLNYPSTINSGDASDDQGIAKVEGQKWLIEVACFLIDCVYEFKRYYQQGGTIGLLQKRNLVRLPGQARVGDTIADFQRFQCRSGVFAFIVRPETVAANAKIEMAIRENIKENLGHSAFGEPILCVRHCKFVTYTWDTWKEDKDRVFEPFHFPDAAGPLGVFALY